MVVSIQGRRMYLSRAVDSEGEVLDLLVQPRRDTAAALRLMRKLLRKQGYAPDELVTDKLGSYGAARRELRLSCRHDQGLRKNNRAENSHQPVRRRERKQQRFKSAGSAQRFLSTHTAVHNTFNLHLPPYPSDLPVRGHASLADCDRCGLTRPAKRGLCDLAPVRVTTPSCGTWLAQCCPT
jgi:putative transposase